MVVWEKYPCSQVIHTDVLEWSIRMSAAYIQMVYTCHPAMDGWMNGYSYAYECTSGWMDRYGLDASILKDGWVNKRIQKERKIKWIDSIIDEYRWRVFRCSLYSLNFSVALKILLNNGINAKKNRANKALFLNFNTLVYPYSGKIFAVKFILS